MNTLVVIPTYNESENIAKLINQLLVFDNLSICVVDDNSPDKTYEIVKKYIDSLELKNKERVNIIVNPNKGGRGAAVKIGFKWGLIKNRFDYFIEMDSDFSHDVKYIKPALNLLKEFDCVIACRYPNAKIYGWPLNRKIVSYSANILARVLINKNIYDYTNGFRFYKKNCIEYLDMKSQSYKGYIYLTESLCYLLKANFKVAQMDTDFFNRTKGQSKTNYKEIINSFVGLIKISINHHLKQ
ncbi:MAG: glycosyltransferase [Bdellovibrionaceae bacterium]|nr:glycosyltransferase [Pseudobdellovibrionaceae bacterium]